MSCDSLTDYYHKNKGCSFKVKDAPTTIHIIVVVMPAGSHDMETVGEKHHEYYFQMFVSVENF